MRHAFFARRRGFSLVELLISMTVFTLAGAALLAIILAANGSLQNSTYKAQIDSAFRATSSSLTPAISASDFIYVFNSPTDSPLVVTPVNFAGDYVVAVYYKNPGYVNSLGVMDTTISRIVGICRLSNTSSTGDVTYPVYMFDSNVNSWGLGKAPLSIASDGSVGSVTALLPTAAQIKTFTQLAPCAFPIPNQANQGSGIFLKNGTGTGVMVMARVRTGTPANQKTGTPGRYLSQIYSYSVSSRNL